MKKQLKLTLLSCLLSIPAITQAGPKDDIYRKGWIDFNKNGTDDYTDILLGARKDAENHPVYNVCPDRGARQRPVKSDEYG